MLEVRNLSVRYRSIPALTEVSLELHPGQLVGVLGPNGAGKSTLVKAILGLVPYGGVISYQGQALRSQRQRTAYVPQRSHIDWDYPVTAWNVVMMAHTVGSGWCRRPDRRAEQRSHEALARVGMTEYSHRPIGQLSGGQQQRIFLARALAQQADIFLFDEPLTGVDKVTEQVMLDVFTELRDQGKILLICSHEWGDALYRYDRLVLLNRTLLANDTPQAVMTSDSVHTTFGLPLFPPSGPTSPGAYRLAKSF